MQLRGGRGGNAGREKAGNKRESEREGLQHVAEDFNFIVGMEEQLKVILCDAAQLLKEITLRKTKSMVTQTSLCYKV